jgi:hypothetical protein
LQIQNKNLFMLNLSIFSSVHLKGRVYLQANTTRLALAMGRLARRILHREIAAQQGVWRPKGPS